MRYRCINKHYVPIVYKIRAKLVKRFWIKIEEERGRSTQECFQGLREACGDMVVQNHIIFHDNARSHTTAAVTDLLCRWQWEILEHGCARMAHCATAGWRNFSHYCCPLQQYDVWVTCSEHREALTGAPTAHDVHKQELTVQGGST